MLVENRRGSMSMFAAVNAVTEKVQNLLIKPDTAGALSLGAEKMKEAYEHAGNIAKGMKWEAGAAVLAAPAGIFMAADGIKGIMEARSKPKEERVFETASGTAKVAAGTGAAAGSIAGAAGKAVFAKAVGRAVPFIAAAGSGIDAGLAFAKAREFADNGRSDVASEQYASARWKTAGAVAGLVCAGAMTVAASPAIVAGGLVVSVAAGIYTSLKGEEHGKKAEELLKSKSAADVKRQTDARIAPVATIALAPAPAPAQAGNIENISIPEPGKGKIAERIQSRRMAEARQNQAPGPSASKPGAQG